MSKILELRTERARKLVPRLPTALLKVWVVWARRLVLHVPTALLKVWVVWARRLVPRLPTALLEVWVVWAREFVPLLPTAPHRVPDLAAATTTVFTSNTTQSATTKLCHGASLLFNFIESGGDDGFTLNMT